MVEVYTSIAPGDDCKRLEHPTAELPLESGDLATVCVACSYGWRVVFEKSGREDWADQFVLALRTDPRPRGWETDTRPAR